jgi:hypothetical protein
MSIRFFSARAAACMGALCATTALGCGSSSGAICDVDFGSIAGSYSFTWKTHNSRYENSCFDTFGPDPIDPAQQTGCTWTESTDDETIVVELVIEENGDIGNAKITSVTDEDGDVDEVDGGVQCEMLEGELCDAPIRCTLTGQTCNYTDSGDPDEWKYSCNCLDGSANDPASAACQECKTSYDKYVSERDEYCEKGRAGDYFEFTLHVKE